MSTYANRQKVRFLSDGIECVAWYYPSGNGTCVIMAGGLGVIKEPGTDPFAERFHRASYGVLAFDYRYLGESGGTPRQLVGINDQIADWQAAIEFAPNLPGVDADKLAIWGFSQSAGHVFVVAGNNPQLAAAIAQSPLADAVDIARNALRHMTPMAAIRLTGRSIADSIGGLFGLQPLMTPLAGERGTVALLTTPDSRNGAQAVNPGNKFPNWRQEVSARAVLNTSLYRPGRHAPRVQCPLLVVAYENDGVAPPRPAVRAAKSAPRGELAYLRGGHYQGYLDGHEETIEILLTFLNKHLGP